MLRISKTIKKIALSLLVVGLAIGTQSYKNAEKPLSPILFGKQYDSPTTFHWVELPPGAQKEIDYNCSETEDICTATFSNDNPLTGIITVQDTGLFSPL